MLVNGTTYHDDTAPEVVRILEQFNNKPYRIRVHYGHTDQNHPKFARDWMEENDVEGFVSRTISKPKRPMLVYFSNSIAGISIYTEKIIKIVAAQGKRILYVHPSYSRPELTIRKNHDKELLDLGVQFYVCYDDEYTAGFKSLRAAQNYVNKMS